MTPTKKEAKIIGRIQDLEDLVRTLARYQTDANITLHHTIERLDRVENALRKGFEV